MDNSCLGGHHQSHSPHGVGDMPNTRYACSKEDVPWTMGYLPRSRRKWDSPWLMSQIMGWRIAVCFLEGWSRYVTRNYRHCLILKHGYISLWRRASFAAPSFSAQVATEPPLLPTHPKMLRSCLRRGWVGEGKDSKKQGVHFWIHCQSILAELILYTKFGEVKNTMSRHVQSWNVCSNECTCFPKLRDDLVHVMPYQYSTYIGSIHNPALNGCGTYSGSSKSLPIPTVVTLQ